MRKIHNNKVIFSIILSALLTAELALLPATSSAAINNDEINSSKGSLERNEKEALNEEIKDEEAIDESEEEAEAEESIDKDEDGEENEKEKDQEEEIKYENPSYDEINEKLEAVAEEMDIPSTILKVIAFRESTWRQFDSQGKPLLGANKEHPAIGIMQIATYDPKDEETIKKLKYDIDFNIRRGAELLDEKWRFTPRIGDGDRSKLENWYFAIWAYNIWSEKNNPNVIARVLEEAKDKSSTDRVSRGGNPDTTDPVVPKVAYQDSVIELCANPDGFLKYYIDPIEIPKIPRDQLPETGLPSKTQKWETPTLTKDKELEKDNEKDNNNHNKDNIKENTKGSTKEDNKNSKNEKVTFTRLSGDNRIDTAIRQALYGWPEGAEAVVLARYDDFPDALAGVTLAAKQDAPILLTPSDKLLPQVKETLETLNPEKIYLLGGEGALTPSIAKELKNLGYNDDQQIRLTGLNRYETAANIATHIAESKGVDAVAIATGNNFTGALSIASIAGAQQMPILLTNPKILSPETKKALSELNPKTIYIIGNEKDISEEVQQQIKKHLNLSSSKINRLAGESRYDTMAAIIQHFSKETQGLSFATGQDFPDALAGAALAAKQNTILTLIPKTPLNNYPDLKTAIQNHPTKQKAPTYIFGGPAAISEEQEQELKELFSK